MAGQSPDPEDMLKDSRNALLKAAREFVEDAEGIDKLYASGEYRAEGVDQLCERLVARSQKALWDAAHRDMKLNIQFRWGSNIYPDLSEALTLMIGTLEAVAGEQREWDKDEEPDRLLLLSDRVDVAIGALKDVAKEMQSED